VVVQTGTEAPFRRRWIHSLQVLLLDAEEDNGEKAHAGTDVDAPFEAGCDLSKQPSLAFCSEMSRKLVSELVSEERLRCISRGRVEKRQLWTWGGGVYEE